MVKVALVQFDAVPEKINQNLEKMDELVVDAVKLGARWVFFHEGTICDYTPKYKELAEKVPEGPSTSHMIKTARNNDCYISFGLDEVCENKYYITQVFVSQHGFEYRYRKSWLMRESDNLDSRGEWRRFDPGNGPELFQMDGYEATCFICADGEAPRCIERAKNLQPEVVFYPNNRAHLPKHKVFANRAKEIGAPMLVTNRIGKVWDKDCLGGCTIYSGDGQVIAEANRKGEEEILFHDLDL